MKRKAAPTIQATVYYHSRPVGHVDRRLRKLARDWDGKQSVAGYEECLDLRVISFVFPTGMKRYRFIQRARKHLREIEYSLCGRVQFK